MQTAKNTKIYSKIALFFLLVSCFGIVRQASADVALPVFTAGTDFGRFLTPIGTETLSGNLYYKAAVLADVGGCNPGLSPQLRHQTAQWYGTTWVISGFGGSAGCKTGGNFLLKDDILYFLVNNTADGYYCQLYCTGGVTCNESLNVKHACVYQETNPVSGEKEYNVLNAVAYDGQTYDTALNTAFVDVQAVGGDLLITHFVDPDEYNPALSQYNPTTIRLQYALKTTTTPSGIGFDMAGITGIHTTTGDVSGLPDGLYDGKISFSNFGCLANLSPCPFPNVHVYIEFSMSSGTVSILETEYFDSTTYADETAEQECSLSNISGCIVNALRALFVPDQQSMTQFSDSWQEIRTKPPFGYITSIIDKMGNIDITATAAYNFPDMPFVSAIFTPIRDALGLFLWGIFAIFFYQRVTKIEI